MEAIFAPSSAADQSVSPYKQINNTTKKNNRGYVYKPPSAENFVPINSIYGSLLCAHPAPYSLSFSYPPTTSFPIFDPHQQNQWQQPPLLPLPISKPRNSLPLPATRKTNRIRVQSLAPKKSKQPVKKEDPKQALKATEATAISTESFITASPVPVGPEPNDLPKDVSKVLSSSSSSTSLIAGNDVDALAMKDLERFSGSVFMRSPPPSSLPLPKFSIRPKRSCTAEAGIDDGATDNLRRLLRLR